MFHLLQVGNVGQILGGTAACAWTVTQCLPDCRHTVAFLSPVSGETRTAFDHADVVRWTRVTSKLIRSSQADLVLLHNTPDVRCENRLPVPSLQ